MDREELRTLLSRGCKEEIQQQLDKPNKNVPQRLEVPGRNSKMLATNDVQKRNANVWAAAISVRAKMRDAMMEGAEISFTVDARELTLESRNKLFGVLGVMSDNKKGE